MKTIPVPFWFLVMLASAALGVWIGMWILPPEQSRPTKAGLYISQNAVQWSSLDRQRLYFLCIPDEEPVKKPAPKEEPSHDEPPHP